MASSTHDFLNYLTGHPEVREKLYHAVEEDVIEAAREAGFELEKCDIDRLFKDSKEDVALTAWSR